MRCLHLPMPNIRSGSKQFKGVSVSKPIAKSMRRHTSIVRFDYLSSATNGFITIYCRYEMPFVSKYDYLSSSVRQRAIHTIPFRLNVQHVGANWLLSIHLLLSLSRAHKLSGNVTRNYNFLRDTDTTRLHAGPCHFQLHIVRTFSIVPKLWQKNFDFCLANAFRTVWVRVV